MRTQITSANPVFHFESNTVRIVLIENEPWFVAKDVCQVLGIQNSRETMSRLDSSEYVLIKKTDRRLNLRSINCDHIFNMDKKISGTSAVYLINESGLYSLVFRSRKPEALKFTKWVTSEVLPTIRKTGTYSVTQQKEKPASLRDLIKKDFIMARDMFSTLPDPMRSCAYRELIDKTISIYKNRLAILLEAHH